MATENFFKNRARFTHLHILRAGHDGGGQTIRASGISM